jgi:hypothetical protein
VANRIDSVVLTLTATSHQLNEHTCPKPPAKRTCMSKGKKKNRRDTTSTCTREAGNTSTTSWSTATEGEGEGEGEGVLNGSVQDRWRRGRPSPVASSITRLTTQKLKPIRQHLPFHSSSAAAAAAAARPSSPGLPPSPSPSFTRRHAKILGNPH